SSHKTKAGEHVPSYGAAGAELVAIARAVRETGAGVLQLVSDSPQDVNFDLMADLVRASGRPLSFSSGPGRAPQATLDRLTACNQAGLPMLAQGPAPARGAARRPPH